MFWIITHDLITKRDEDGFGVGRKSGEATPVTYTFKLFDDDGEHYYTGQCDTESFLEEDGEPGSLYFALMWAQRNAGATDLRLKLSDILLMLPGEDNERVRDVYKRIARKDGWVSIYG